MELLSCICLIFQTGSHDDPDAYTRGQIRAADCSGIRLRRVTVSNVSSSEELVGQIAALNCDPSVHGITVQLPIIASGNFDTDEVLNAIDPNKDVDGLSTCQLAHICSGSYLRWKQCPFLIHPSCVAAACLLLLQETGPIPIGLRCLVVGRGRLVGTPVASLMLRSANATTTICHTGTRCLEEEVNRAEILITGVGKTNLVKGDWIRAGAIVIDCGIDVSSGKVLGDVEFEKAVSRAAWITPVPGGVGPLTFALLMRSTLNAAKRFHNLSTHSPLMEPTGILLE